MNPKQITVCDKCGQSWEKHLSLAESRLWSENEYLPGVEPSAGEVLGALSLLDCITLLKRANQGPMGPQGPTGLMGISS